MQQLQCTFSVDRHEGKTRVYPVYYPMESEVQYRIVMQIYRKNWYDCRLMSPAVLPQGVAHTRKRQCISHPPGAVFRDRLQVFGTATIPNVEILSMENRPTEL